MILLELFRSFIIIGFVSFGGGYAMIPIIEIEAVSKGWVTSQQFADGVVVAGMAPGPIATNTAIFVGYSTAGIPGAIAAGTGVVLPSLLLVVIVSVFFYRMNKNKHVRAALYGLRPVVTGLIVFAAIRFAVINELTGPLSWTTLMSVIIFALSLFAIMKLRMHPLKVILLSGAAGMLVFT